MKLVVRGRFRGPRRKVSDVVVESGRWCRSAGETGRAEIGGRINHRADALDIQVNGVMGMGPAESRVAHEEVRRIATVSRNGRVAVCAHRHDGAPATMVGRAASLRKPSNRTGKWRGSCRAFT